MNIQKQAKNIVFTTIMIAVVAMASVGVSSVIAQNNSGSQVLTTSGNAGSNTGFTKFQLRPKRASDLSDLLGNSFIEPMLPNEDFWDVNNLTEGKRNFHVFGNSIIDVSEAHNDAAFTEGLNIGYASPAAATAASTDAEVNFRVNGNIILRDLADPACTDAASCASSLIRPVCVNDFGRLVICTQ